METTLPSSIKELASAPVKKNRTSGSEPVWKSVSTRDLKVSSEVAEESLTLIPVSFSNAATASL